MVDEHRLAVVPGGATEAGANDGDEALVERREAIVTVDQHGERLDKAIVAFVPEFSRSHLQGLIKAGWAEVDGAPATSPAQRIRAGQRLVVTLQPTEESRAYRPEALPLAIVHEDADVLVIDKAAGMVVHPAAGNWSGTLLNALLARDPASAALPRAGIVHRLDKDTSGLMVVGRTLAAVTALTRAIAAREVQRRYLAIALGTPPGARFTVEAPIGRDPKVRTRMAVVASGKPARTDVERVAIGDGFAALRCTLHTGRTHQIRVHLASRGLPLVGDRLYGGAPALGMQRQALHASQLEFRHPSSAELLSFRRAPPSDFAHAWAQVG
ncbi:MAG TPA: RluA family pseudouridine synthase, partial [Caldimonas sp.]